MAQIAARPPDLDAAGSPVGTRPPDLDADGVPMFRQSDQTPNDLPWYSDPTSQAYGKLFDAIVNHLPTILGGAGGIIGGTGGTILGTPVGGAAAATGGAALGGAAGEAFKELINKVRGKAPAGTAAQAVTDMAKQAVAQGAAQATGEYVVGPVMSSIGARVMQSAVKPGLKILQKTPAGQTPQVVKTLLDEGINVTPGGVQRLRALIDTSNDEIAAALAPHASAEIPALKVAGRLTDTSKRFGAQVNAQSDLDAISKVGENFLDHPAITERGTITLADAQRLKRGTYQQIGSKYGQPNASATIAAEKSLARGLKEEIAAEVPEVSSLNAREGKLLEALSAVGKRVALTGNKDPIGFAWVAHNPTTFLAALFDRSPAVKSLVARGLYNGAGAAAKVSPQLIRIAVASLASENPEAGLGTSSDPSTR